MNQPRRHLCATFATAAALAFGASALHAQDAFPSKPVKIIVAYTAGTGGDVVSRIVADALGRVLGQPVIVENNPGAGGILGTEHGAKAPPDGYTLTLATAGTLIVTPVINPAVRYKADRDFTPVGGVARSAFVVVTANTPEAPSSFQELVRRLKEKEGTYGSPGAGTTTHLAAEIVFKQAGIKVKHVPYRGSTQSLTDVASGQVSIGVDTVGGSLPLVKAGKLKALAVTGDTHVASLPGVPTVSESGVAGLNVVGWWGLVAPAGTPPDVVGKLSDALVKALEQPDVRERLARQEVEPFPLPAAAFGGLIRKETPMWADRAAENNMAAK